MSSYRTDRRARSRRALDRVRGRGAPGPARVGDRPVRAGPRDLDLVPDRQRRADRHGLRDRPGDPGLQRRHRPPPGRDARARRPPRARYPGLNLELVEPDADEIDGMTGKHGVDLFKTSVDLRLLCCNLRKVRPLTKHLHSLDAWVTGLRRDQWASRTNIRKVEIDHDHGAIVKLNPLAEWTEDEVWDYVREREVPYHSLYDKGYTSIGCAPCTRAIAPDEPSRAGRWWWETNAPKECGIHCSIESGGLEHELHAILKDIALTDGGSRHGEAAEVARAEAQAVLAMVQDETRRGRLADVVAAVDDGEVEGDDADALAELLELGLATGRVRAVYGPEGEQAALALFRRLPLGKELTESARDLNEALGALEGRTIDESRSTRSDLENTA